MANFKVSYSPTGVECILPEDDTIVLNAASFYYKCPKYTIFTMAGELVTMTWPHSREGDQECILVIPQKIHAMMRPHIYTDGETNRCEIRSDNQKIKYILQYVVSTGINTLFSSFCYAVASRQTIYKYIDPGATAIHSKDIIDFYNIIHTLEAA